MQLMRRQETREPIHEMEDLANRINRFFGSAGWPGGFFSKWPGNGDRELLAAADWSPTCDISETDKEYRIRAELPSVERDDVHVTLDDRILTIQGERREEKQERGVKVHRRELCYGSFLRRFTMPGDADESKVDATFKDGMLNVIIGKSKTKASKATEIVVH
jgi:HSP20 family protein